MSVLEFRGVSHKFGSFTAIHPLDLAIGEGEFVTLLGPSGSGKSTLLNLAAGYCVPSGGQVLLGGRDVTALPPRKRHIGMVFQSYALFPHMSVFENVAYGLRVRRVGEAELKKRVAAVLDLLQLGPLAQRMPSQLSGGQQQRVAVARALVIEPSIMLFDEPFGALDRQLRKQVQTELRALHRQIGATMVFVTHDQEEALILSDRIAVMRGGRIEQLGTGRELYEKPISAFVAGFLGESNMVAGTVREVQGDMAAIELPEFGLVAEAGAAPGLRVGDAASLVLRPEAIRIERENALCEVEVVELVYLGEKMETKLRLANGRELSCVCPSDREIGLSQKVPIGWPRRGGRIVPRD
ncbi:MAG: ABC transporter ATP-binding protein [Mesorhizobium sp.]